LHKVVRNFGHIARKNAGLRGRVISIFTWLFGVPNLAKRSQMQDIFDVVAPETDDIIVDFGPGSGYITIEFSRYAKSVIAIDVREINIDLPLVIAQKIEFRCYDGKIENIPLEDGCCDKIFSGEVLQAIENRIELYHVWQKSLKDDGRVIICQGVGRPIIERAFQNKHWLIKLLARCGGPATFDEYSSLLNTEFRAKDKNFIPQEKIIEELVSSGFEIESIIPTPSDAVVTILEWTQYILKTLLGRARYINHPIVFMLVYPCCIFAKAFSNKRDLDYGILISAKMRDR